MTCKEQYIKDHPNLSEEALEGVMRNMCPHDYGYLDEAYWCNGRNDDNCKKCWNREIPEDDKKPVAFKPLVTDKIKDDTCRSCIHYGGTFGSNAKLCRERPYNPVVGNVILCERYVSNEKSESEKFKEAGESFTKSVADGLEGANAAAKAFVERFNEAAAKMSKYSGVVRGVYSSKPWPMDDKEPECVTPPELTEDAKKAIDAISKYVGDKFGLSVDTPQIKDNNEEVIKEPVDVTIGDISLRDISSESLKVTVKPGDTVNVSASDSSSSTTRTGMIKDSGARKEFGTGAVRDIQEGKGRCDLLPLDVICDYLLTVKIPECQAHMVLEPIYKFITDSDIRHLEDSLESFVASHDWHNHFTMFLEVSKHFEEGAKKYGEYNWQKGIPTRCYIDSAVRHYFKHIRGDKDEPHDRAFVWNILCCIWTCIHKPELNDYSKSNKELDL